MKYSYTSSHRGGKSHYKLLAQLNNKSFCGIQQGRELHATIIRDNIISWYWEEYGGTVCWEDKEIDLTNKETDLDYTKECYRKDGSMWIDFDRPVIPNNLYKVFPKFFECDFILYPLPLLGYYGYPKPGDTPCTMDICDALEQQEAWMTVDLEYSIKELRKRRNIIAYKEDKRHEAWNFFTGGGDATLLKDGNEQEYYRQCSLRIDDARRMPDSVRKLYNHYNIPYEMFSLDTGNYKEVFNIDKDIPNNYTEKFDVPNIIQEYIDNGKIDEWIDEYLNEI